MYNGVEYEESLGLNLYEMDFRQYDPAIGRFNVIDPLAESMPDLTTYRFSYNNPIYWSDPSGLFESRREARRYRRANNLKGNIVKNSDDSFTLHTEIKKNGDGTWKSSIAYQKITEDTANPSMGQNVGGVESVITAFTNKSYVGKLNRSLSEHNGLVRFFIESGSDVRSHAELADLQAQDPSAAVISHLNSSLSLQSYAENSFDSSNGPTGGNNSGVAIPSRRSPKPNPNANAGSNANPGQTTPTMGKHTPYVVNGKPKTVTVSGKEKVVYEGSEGGKYYINDNGNREGLDREGNKRKR